MLIRLRETGSVITDSEFRQMHANTSFPVILDKDLLDSFGADPVLEGPQPSLTRYQLAAMDGVRQDGEHWVTNWVAIDMDEAARASLDARQAAAIRIDRNRRLADCDWTQLSDAPINGAAWAEYRQSLRDITAQPGFPWELVWPIPPSLS